MSTAGADRLLELPPEQRARLMAELRDRAVRRVAPSAIPRRDPAAPPPLSFEQRRLWIINQLDPDGTAYNESMRMRLEQAVDPALLNRALDDVAARHEILRTTFHAREGGPVQVVHPPAPVPLRVEDLSALPPAERAAAAARAGGEELARRFDLARGPLFRGLLLRLGPAESFVLLVMHHMITDGTSKALLMEEVTARYAALAAGAPGSAAPLPEPALQFGDWAAWQQGWAQGPEFAAHLEHFRQALRGAPELLELPTDRPRPPQATRHAAAPSPCAFPPPGPRRCGRWRRARGAPCSPCCWRGGRRCWRGTPGRTTWWWAPPSRTAFARRWSRSWGPCSTSSPCGATCPATPPSASLLARLHATTLAAFEHQGAPFEKVVEVVRPARSLSHEPVFQVLFELHNAARSGPFAGSPPRIRRRAEAGPPRAPAPRAPAVPRPVAIKNDLTLTFAEHTAGVAGVLQYATDLFAHETAARMLAHYRALLEQVVRDPDVRLSALALLRRRGARAGGGRVEPHGGPVSPRLHPRAVRGAGAPHAGRRRRRPRRGDDDVRGAGRGGQPAGARAAPAGDRPGGRVALCLERGLDLMTAFFGILKAGAAYVPLDPTHPADRLALHAGGQRRAAFS